MWPQNCICNSYIISSPRCSVSSFWESLSIAVYFCVVTVNVMVFASDKKYPLYFELFLMQLWCEYLSRLYVCVGARVMKSIFPRSLSHGVPIDTTGDQGLGLFQVIWKCSGDVYCVSFRPWAVLQWLHNKKCLLVTHSKLRASRRTASRVQRAINFSVGENGCQKLGRMSWWIRCRDSWDTCTCDSEGSVRSDSSQSWTSSELTLKPSSLALHFLQAAHSTAAGEMEHAGAWPGTAAEGSTLLTSEQCLFCWKKAPSVHFWVTFPGGSFWIRQSVIRL